MIDERVDATELFTDYASRGLPFSRHARALVMTFFFLGTAVFCMMLSSDLPERSCIRGAKSIRVDTIVMFLSSFGFTWVLFYALDAAVLAGRLLRAISDKPTAWPEWLSRKSARELCLRDTDLDGWIDVKFAAVKTNETAQLMLYPFVILTLL